MGAQLLRHALTDRLPEELSVREQARALSPLKRLLELDGFSCQSEAAYAGKTVPLLVSKGSKQLAVGIRSGLLDASWNQHCLSPLASSNRAILLNEFILRRNLPDEHQLIRRMF
jgi:hypothetical protein